jgi:predicted DNA-binding ribbon-helix-helix protein
VGDFSSRLSIFSVKIGGRWTTIRLEDELMDALREISRSIGIGLNELCTEVALDRLGGSYTSALRVFVVNYYRGLAGARVAREGAQQGSTARSMLSRPLAIGEAAPELGELFGWWREQQPTKNRMPDRQAIDPDMMQQLGLGGMIHVVDASAADPMNYRLRVFGRKIAQIGGSDFAGWRIGDVPGRDYVSAACRDYFTVATTGVPRLHEVDASVEGHRRVYQRLIAPFSSVGSRKPDCLLVAVVYQSTGLLGELDQNLGA